MSTKHYDKLSAQLKLSGYSERSQKSYIRAVRQLENFAATLLDEITEEDIQRYWVFCKDELKWRASTMRISYSGIKFFFLHTIPKEWDTLKLLKVEAEHRLPVVLSKDEVRDLLRSVRTPQNRAFFSMTYSCGLRLQEALSIKLGDIDGKRGFVHVRQGKGCKDRYVPLPEDTLLLLRKHWSTHRNPTWMFPSLGRDGKQGPVATQPMSNVTAQGALRKAVKQLGLKKHATPHTFRHSYATHLIEAHVPIRHVQQYLGHSSLASTMIYVHVTSIGEGDSRCRINELMRGVLS
jgi:integrase/recombinase XerD